MTRSFQNKDGTAHRKPPKMELTTMVGCPLMCTFCPQDNLRANYGKARKYMRLQDLSQILDKLPKNMIIYFAGMAEPWANPNCTEMLRTVLERHFRVAIYTTLYGMTPDDARVVAELLEAHDSQITTLKLHLPDANGNMRGWKNTEQWRKAFSIIKQVKVSCGVETMTMDYSGVIHADVVELVGAVSNPFAPNSRAGSLDVGQIEGQRITRAPRHEKPVMCKYTPVYDKNILLPNGDVVLCCMDYDKKHVIGNLLDQSYEELFTSQAFLDLVRINETAGYSDKSICKSCSMAIPLKNTSAVNEKWHRKLAINLLSGRRWAAEIGRFARG